MESHERWMKRALKLARKGKGHTSPNPAVGAVIVKDGKIIGEGWHKKAGGPHAEVEAISACKESPKGASIYVTLEPCNHQGRTGPCTEAIIDAGITEVYIGARDTSPKKGKRGAETLRRAGLEVTAGVMKKECKSAVEDFIKHSATGMPMVTLKAALTLDGKIAAKTGDSKWITCEQSRKIVHQMRSEMDAVMVGARTVKADDPELTVRFGAPRRNPLRVIVDGGLKTSLKSNIAQTAKSFPTLIAALPDASDRKIASFKKLGVEVVKIRGRRGKINLEALMKELGRRGVMSVLMESGGELASAAIEACVVDKVMFFIAPKIAGGGYCAIPGAGVKKMENALNLDDVEVTQSGPDVVVTGVLKRK